MSSVIRDAPKYFRAMAPMAKPKSVDLEERLVKGAVASTVGEALGHGLWLDGIFMEQIVAAGNEAAGGVKVRFGHPMSGDGIGKAVAKATNFRLSRGKVLCDLKMLSAASASPNGDLAGYVLQMADEAPDMFGMSIVYEPDTKREDEFIVEQSQDGVFRSPDRKNKENLPHARLRKLRAVDVVDEPAAAPTGLFSETSELFTSANMLLEYVFLGGPEPGFSAFSIAPERVRAHVNTWLSKHGLCVEETSMTSDTETVEPESQLEEVVEVPQLDTDAVDLDAVVLEEAPVEAIESNIAEVERSRALGLLERFKHDMEFARAKVADGSTIEAATVEHYPVLLAKWQAAVKATGSTPVERGHSEVVTGMDAFMAASRQLASEANISITEAMKQIDRKNPQLRKEAN